MLLKEGSDLACLGFFQDLLMSVQERNKSPGSRSQIVPFTSRPESDSRGFL